jgi:hypothetical protein
MELHGGQTAALQALINQSDELDRLKRAVQSCGLSLKLLGIDDGGGLAGTSSGETHCSGSR